MSKDITSFLLAVVYLAVLFVLVRPGSQGPSFITNVTNGIASVINAGTGGGGWAAGS